MLLYFLKRTLFLIPLLIGITLISFFVIHLAPGKPSDVSGDLNPKISLEVRHRLEKLYELDAPLTTQYAHWLKRFIKFDFGKSFADGRPVIDKFFETIPITLFINITSLILILALGIPLGIAAALKKDSFFDKATMVFVFFTFALPTFWLALILMDLIGVQLRWLPISGITSLDFEYLGFFGKMADVAKHLALPIFVSTIGGLAGISRYMRQNMLEVIDKKYILAARSRAIPENIVLYKHGLKNALLPIITILGLSIPGLIGGSVIFESIFAIPGTGRLFFTAVMARDYPVIMAMLCLSAILTLLGNLLADIGYALCDPRIRYSERE